MLESPPIPTSEASGSADSSSEVPRKRGRPTLSQAIASKRARLASGFDASIRLQRFEKVVDWALGEMEKARKQGLTPKTSKAFESLLARCTPAMRLVSDINGDMLRTGDKLVQAEEAMRMGADARSLAPEEAARRAQAFLQAYNDAEPSKALFVLPKQERSTGTPPRE